MRLYEIANKPAKGLFAAANVCDICKRAIDQYITDANIPNPVSVDDMHCTILYSRTPCPNYTPITKYDKPYVAKPNGFKLFGEKKNVLVLSLDCPELSDRHRHLMDEHNATYDYPTYKPHITLSYDFDGDVNDLKPYTDDILLVGEYSEEVDIE